MNVSALGSFTFTSAVPAGTSYTIIFTSQPNYTAPSTCSVANTRRCTISNATGTMGSSSVTNVAVACATILAANCDATKNGTESDTDCGGTTAALCPTGRACTANSDCQSNSCPVATCN